MRGRKKKKKNDPTASHPRSSIPPSAAQRKSRQMKNTRMWRGEKTKQKRTGRAFVRVVQHIERVRTKGCGTGTRRVACVYRSRRWWVTRTLSDPKCRKHTHTHTHTHTRVCVRERRPGGGSFRFFRERQNFRRACTCHHTIHPQPTRRPPSLGELNKPNAGWLPSARLESSGESIHSLGQSGHGGPERNLFDQNFHLQIPRTLGG